MQSVVTAGHLAFMATKPSGVTTATQLARTGESSTVSPAVPSRRAQQVMVGVLLALAALQAATGTLLKSPTFDEPRYLGLGIYLAEHGRWDVEDALAHPPLPYYLHSIPLTFLDIPERVWSIGSSIQRGQAIIRLYPDDLVIRLARAPTILLALLLGVYVYRWGKELYGFWAGVLGLALYCFNPMILTMSAIVNADIPVTTFGFIAVYYWWRHLREGRRRDLLLSGLHFGLALLSKYSAPLLLPVFVILGVASIYRRSPGPATTQRTFASSWRQVAGGMAVVCVLAGVMLWAGYGFETGFAAPPERRPHAVLDRLFAERPGLHKASYFVAEHIPIPAPSYLKGTALLFMISKSWNQYFPGGNTNFLHGHYSSKGFRDYYAIAFLIKTPVGTLLLLGLAVVLFPKLRSREWMDEAFLLTPIVFLFLYFSLGSNIQIGLRYVLAVFPFLFVFAGRAANLGKHWKSKWAQVSVGVLLAATAASTIAAHPNHLAYFNELVGGSKNGYRWLVDSNLDWGQDLGGLKRYMDAHGIHSVKLSYFGTAEPEYYGIDYEYLPSSMVEAGWSFLGKAQRHEHVELPARGIIAISATELQGTYFADKNIYGWLKQRRPEAVIGHSIFIYKVE